MWKMPFFGPESLNVGPEVNVCNYIHLYTVTYILSYKIDRLYRILILILIRIGPTDLR